MLDDDDSSYPRSGKFKASISTPKDVPHCVGSHPLRHFPLERR